MARIEPFEKYSNEYDEWFDCHADLYAAELDAVRRLVPASASEGLEVGVGSGKFAVPLGIRIGLEPSEKMAAKARSHGIKVCSGVAEKLPFPDGRFDFVLMVTTICFVDDVVKSLLEVYRVLKPGGSLIVGFIDRESGLGRQYLEKRTSSRFYQDATFFSAPEVRENLERSGFGVANILQTLVSGESTGTVFEGYGKGAFVVIKGVKKKDR